MNLRDKQGRRQKLVIDPAFEPAPVEIVNPDATLPLLLIGDHAGRAVPRAMDTLGLGAEALGRHIAWDIGAAGVARGVAQRLGASAVLATFTRLLIDPNRPLGDADCIPTRSDGIPIPGNLNLTLPDLEARAAAFYWPYHGAIDLALARLSRDGATPVLLSVHSFTPALMSAGSARPWHVGVMASRDRRFADALLAALGTQPGLVTAFNEPYSGITHGYCLKVHGLAQGIPHAQIEIRQDQICTPAGEAWCADLLARVLPAIMADPALQRPEHY